MERIIYKLLYIGLHISIISNVCRYIERDKNSEYGIDFDVFNAEIIYVPQIEVEPVNQANRGKELENKMKQYIYVVNSFIFSVCDNCDIIMPKQTSSIEYMIL